MQRSNETTSTFPATFTNYVSMQTMGRHVKNHTAWGRMFALYYARKKVEALATALKNWHQYQHELKQGIDNPELLHEAAQKFAASGIYEIPNNKKFRKFCNAIAPSLRADNYNNFPWNFWQTSDEFVGAIYKACRVGFVDYNQLTTILSLHYGIMTHSANDITIPENAGSIITRHGVPEHDNLYYYTVDLTIQQSIEFLLSMLSGQLSTLDQVYTFYNIRFEDIFCKFIDRSCSHSAILNDKINRQETLASVANLRILNQWKQESARHQIYDSLIMARKTLYNDSTSIKDRVSMQFLAEIVKANIYGIPLVGESTNFSMQNPDSPILTNIVYPANTLNTLIAARYPDSNICALPAAGYVSPWMMLALYAPESSLYASMLSNLIMHKQPTSCRVIEYPYPGIKGLSTPHKRKTYIFAVSHHDCFHAILMAQHAKDLAGIIQRLITLYHSMDGLRYSANFSRYEYNLLDQGFVYSQFLLRYGSSTSDRCASMSGSELAELMHNQTGSHDSTREYYRRSEIHILLSQQLGVATNITNIYLVWHDIIKNPQIWQRILFNNSNPYDFFPPAIITIDTQTSFKEGLKITEDYMRIHPDASATEVLIWHQLQKLGVDKKLLRRLHGFDFKSCFIWQPNKGLRLNENTVQRLRADGKYGPLENVYIKALITLGLQNGAAILWDAMFPGENLNALLHLDETPPPPPQLVKVPEAPGKQRILAEFYQLLAGTEPLPLNMIINYINTCQINIHQLHEGMNLFGHAIRTGSVELAQHLIEAYGIDVNNTDHTFTPLMLALIYNHMDIFHLLLQHNADINTKLDALNPSPYLSCPWFVSKIAMSGTTALQLAICYNNFEATQILISAGGIIDDEDQNTPLHLACYYGHIQLIQLLLNITPHDIDAKNKIHITPLLAYFDAMLNYQKCFYYADHKNDGTSAFPIYQLFCNYGADIVARGRNGLSLIHLAASANAIDVVTDLIAQDITTLDMRTDRGESALLFACKHHHLQLAALLVEKYKLEYNNWHIDNIVTINNHTILSNIVKPGYERQNELDTIKFLLENHANPDSPLTYYDATDNWQSLIYSAIICHQHHYTDLFMAYGANIDHIQVSQDNNFQNAYELALSCNNYYVIRKYLAGHINFIDPTDHAYIHTVISRNPDVSSFVKKLCKYLSESQLITPSATFFQQNNSKQNKLSTAVTALLQVVLGVADHEILTGHISTLKNINNGDLYRTYRILKRDGLLQMPEATANGANNLPLR